MRAGGNNTCPFEVLNWFWCHWSAQPMTPKVNSVTAGSLTRKAPGRFRRAIFRVRLAAGRDQRGAGSNIHSTQAGREASCAGPGNGGRGPPGRLGTVRFRAGTSSSEISTNKSFENCRIVAHFLPSKTERLFETKLAAIAAKFSADFSLPGPACKQQQRVGCIQCADESSRIFSLLNGWSVHCCAWCILERLFTTM